MEYGICGDPSIAEIAAGAGYDYIELHVQRDLMTEDDAGSFSLHVAHLRSLAVRASVANCFVPGRLKITGPEVDMSALESYVTMALSRAEQAGIDMIVFGSGGARRIPDGFDRNAAWQQLVDFGQMVSPIADRHGVTIVVEPLRRQECNVFNSIGECARYVREIDDTRVRLLVDAYHWAQEDDSYEDLVNALDLIKHAHIATYKSRRAPGMEACDFVPFFRALKEGGYDGSLSIESRWDDMQHEAARALDEMKRQAAAAGLA